MGGLDPGATAGIVLIPMALMGLGIGALASQLGAITVSAFPDELSAEVGGLQNTFTNFGASLGTALVGAVLIGSLTSTFLTGVTNNSAIPPEVGEPGHVELEAGIPFISDADLQQGLATTSLPPATQDGHRGRERLRPARGPPHGPVGGRPGDRGRPSSSPGCSRVDARRAPAPPDDAADAGRTPRGSGDPDA